MSSSAQPSPTAPQAPGATAEQDVAGRGAGLAAVVTAVVAFSWGFVIVKALPLPAAVIGFWRLVMGAGVLAIAALAMRVPWPTRRGPVLAAGVAFGVHQLLYVAATQRTSIAIVTLLGALQPLAVALVSRRVVGEPVPRRLVGCGVLAIAGVAVVMVANIGSESQSLAGNLLALANLVVFTTYFLFTKAARRDDAPSLTVTAAVFGAALLVVGPAFAMAGPASPGSGTAWLLIALLAMLPGNGHLLVNWAHRRLTAALTSLTLAAVPLLSSIWAHLVFGEPYGWRHVAGMLLVVAAIEGGRRAERDARTEQLISRAAQRVSPTPGR